MDEVRIKVTKGLVYANLRQKGTDRSDVYHTGRGQTDAGADPQRPLTVKIAGDNPFGNQTKGKFTLVFKDGGKSEVIPFTVANGKARSWDYPAKKKIKTVAVSIARGDGRAKISLIQPPDPKKAASSQAPAASTKPKPKYTPKAKTVCQFTVTHPSGTSKPLTPGKDLVVTVKGISSDAKGRIDLYTDRKKAKQVDAFKFRLKKNQAESFAVSGQKSAGWATVWVHKGSFSVKLDQSPGAKATIEDKAKSKPKTASAKKTKPSAKAKQSSVPVASVAKPAASTGAIFKGEVPLYNGANVLKSKTTGAYSKASLKVGATPQEVVDFYKNAMTPKGWVPVMAMVQGNKGVLMFKKANRQLVFKVTGQGRTSKIDVTIISR